MLNEKQNKKCLSKHCKYETRISKKSDMIAIQLDSQICAKWFIFLSKKKKITTATNKVTHNFHPMLIFVDHKNAWLTNTRKSDLDWTVWHMKLVVENESIFVVWYVAVAVLFCGCQTTIRGFCLHL